ncbi:DUF6261 family protein [uncultured Kordia sp.]|uniref:DUF6261 family protein n=1 Tax=uncultured Kordia sp. TaxID=507699 RepID=UPI0026309F01|nr:DUF6261 family protein [uncultured Kordia sp.]
MNRPMLDRYRNSEFLQYMKDVLELVNTKDVATLQLVKERDALQNIALEMDNLFQQEQGSGITQELIELDTRRDKAFMGIKGLLETHEHHYDDTMQSAASRLLYNMNTFGTNIPRLNYQAETAVIDSMLSDWETQTDLSTAITTLAMTDWVAELKTANEAFNNRFLARVSESAASTATSFTTMRDDSTNTYRVLVAHIEAHATLGSDVAHQNLANEISELAKQYNVSVNARFNSSNTSEVPSEEETSSE